MHEVLYAVEQSVDLADGEELRACPLEHLQHCTIFQSRSYHYYCVTLAVWLYRLLQMGQSWVASYVGEKVRLEQERYARARWGGKRVII